MDSQPTVRSLHSECFQRKTEGTPRTSLTATDRINANISQLLQRFENIMATATVRFVSLKSTIYLENSPAI